MSLAPHLVGVTSVSARMGPQAGSIGGVGEMYSVIGGFIIRPSGVLCYGAVRLSVCLSVRLSVCPSIRLSVRRPFPHDNSKSFTAIDFKPGI